MLQLFVAERTRVGGSIFLNLASPRPGACLRARIREIQGRGVKTIAGIPNPDAV